MANSLDSFKRRASSIVRDIVSESADILEEEMRKHVGVSGPSLQELAAQGHPFSRDNFRPTSVVDTPFDIISQSGGLENRLGQSMPRWNPVTRTASINVGMEDSGFHNLNVEGFNRTVPMWLLLSWIIEGTPKMGGRDFLRGSFELARDRMQGVISDKGLSKGL